MHLIQVPAEEQLQQSRFSRRVLADINVEDTIPKARKLTTSWINNWRRIGQRSVSCHGCFCVATEQEVMCFFIWTDNACIWHHLLSGPRCDVPFGRPAGPAFRTKTRGNITEDMLPIGSCIEIGRLTNQPSLGANAKAYSPTSDWLRSY